MTTMLQEEVTCAVCGSSQTVQEVGSTNAFGAMDLDTRPPEMRRSTMTYWVHECSECGYVAPELGKTAETDAKRVVSVEYRRELERPDRPRLANRFVCRALLDEAQGQRITAGWRRLHAAWACDDAEEAESAREQRLLALDAFERARAQGEAVMGSVVGGDALLLADIARRAGAFGRAEAYVAEAQALADVPEFIASLLSLQRDLVRARDTACHTVSEATAAPHGGTLH